MRFFTVSQLVEALIEARTDKALSRMRASLKKLDLLVLDELGFVPLPASGAELLFEVVSDRYDRRLRGAGDTGRAWEASDHERASPRGCDSAYRRERRTDRGM